MERNDTTKKERERNDLSEGPRSRTERFQKSQNVPSPRQGPVGAAEAAGGDTDLEAPVSTK